MNNKALLAGAGRRSFQRSTAVALAICLSASSAFLNVPTAAAVSVPPDASITMFGTVSREDGTSGTSGHITTEWTLLDGVTFVDEQPDVQTWKVRASWTAKIDIDYLDVYTGCSGTERGADEGVSEVVVQRHTPTDGPWDYTLHWVGDPTTGFGTTRTHSCPGEDTRIFTGIASACVPHIPPNGPGFPEAVSIPAGQLTDSGSFSADSNYWCASRFTSQRIGWLIGFDNALGTIEVEKQTEPEAKLIPFLFDGDLSGVIFDDQVVSRLVLPGTYRTHELETVAWALDRIECDPGGTGDVEAATATYVVGAGETVRCVFTNRANGGTPVAEPDVLEQDLYTPPGDATYPIDVFENDSDPNGDPITVLDVAKPIDFPGDLLLINPDTGEFLFKPPSDWWGTTEFDYTITDGNDGESEPATVKIAIRACTSQTIQLDNYTQSYSGQEEGQVGSLTFESSHCTDGDRVELMDSALDTSVGGWEWAVNVAISAALSKVAPYAQISIETRWVDDRTFEVGASADLGYCVGVVPKILVVPEKWVKKIWGTVGDILTRLGVRKDHVRDLVDAQGRGPLASAVSICLDPILTPSVDVHYFSDGSLSTDVVLGFDGGESSGLNAVRVFRNDLLIYDVPESTVASSTVHIECRPATDPWTLQCQRSRN